MLSYRHIFHAGNHGDVLKHMILVSLLRYLTQKESPLYYIDTHAGAGLYDLTSKEAKKSQESSQGILRLVAQKDAPALVLDYLEVLSHFNEKGQFKQYPGSPAIAHLLLREHDKLRLFEYHPTDFALLKKNTETIFKTSALSRGKRILSEKKDGFTHLKALLPPPSKRGLILIDPSYEVKSDYQLVLQMLKDALERFKTGTYMIWYPVLQRIESRRFPDKLKKLAQNNWLHVTYQTAPKIQDGKGFVASGVFIINPPWTLEKQLQETMPQLIRYLTDDERASFHIESSLS